MAGHAMASPISPMKDGGGNSQDPGKKATSTHCLEFSNIFRLRL